MRGEEGEKGGEGGMVMMCLHMICRIDITNHLVPMVTPLGRAHTLICTLSLIQAILSHRNSNISLINISLLHLIYFFQRHGCIFKRLLICVCGACDLIVCVWLSVCTSAFWQPEFRSSVQQVCVYTSVCVEQQGALSSVLSPVNGEWLKGLMWSDSAGSSSVCVEPHIS